MKMQKRPSCGATRILAALQGAGTIWWWQHMVGVASSKTCGMRLIGDQVSIKLFLHYSPCLYYKEISSKNIQNKGNILI